MKLNLGAGEERLDGWLSVDRRVDCSDVAADVRQLPFRDGSVDAILARDICEHFPADQSQPLLAEWHRVLVPGGSLTVKVPNLYQLARMIVAYTERQDWPMVRMLIRNIYGGHRWGPEGAWDAHHTGWVPETLYQELQQAGFEVISDDGGLNNEVVAKHV